MTHLMILSPSSDGNITIRRVVRQGSAPVPTMFVHRLFDWMTGPSPCCL